MQTMSPADMHECTALTRGSSAAGAESSMSLLNCKMWSDTACSNRLQSPQEAMPLANRMFV